MARKYVVSSMLELVRGSGKGGATAEAGAGQGLLTSGEMLPRALAELALINEYEFVVHPRIVGHGPTLFADLSKPLDLELVSRMEFDSGAVVLGYVPRR